MKLNCGIPMPARGRGDFRCLDIFRTLDTGYISYLAYEYWVWQNSKDLKMSIKGKNWK